MYAIHSCSGYGYGLKRGRPVVDDLVEKELAPRLGKDTYLDYTGASVYLNSQVRRLPTLASLLGIHVARGMIRTKCLLQLVEATLWGAERPMADQQTFEPEHTRAASRQ